MVKDARFKYHPAVTDFGVKFYAAFQIVTSDGYILGTLCVSDNRVRRISTHKINLLTELAAKLAYQLEVQVNQRKSTAESSIEIMSKLKLIFSEISLENAIVILKFFINDVISSEEKQKMLDLGVAIKNKNNIEVSKFGRKVLDELNLNIGTLKRIKNLSNNDNELMNLLRQI